MLAFATICSPSLAAQSPLRALSFNIRYGTANDGDHAWVNRRSHVITTIRDHAPHLLGIQEALRFQLDEIATAMPGYRVVGVGRDDGVRAGEYSAILVDTARFAVIDEGTFWYSDTPTVPGSLHWGNRITRIATWARLVDRATSDTIRFYNTHWDHESQPSRQRSAALLLDRIATDSAPNDAILVMGDFNADEVNPAFTALLADQRVPLRESFRERHPDATVVGTFNGFKGDSTGGMIDHILVGPGWRVLDAGIDRRRFGALWASDHFAVLAGLEREKERKRERENERKRGAPLVPNAVRDLGTRSHLVAQRFELTAPAEAPHCVRDEERHILLSFSPSLFLSFKGSPSR